MTRREPEREKGLRGARKWVQRALEEAGELGESWGHLSHCPWVPTRGSERMNCVRLEIKGIRGQEQSLERHSKEMLGGAGIQVWWVLHRQSWCLFNTSLALRLGGLDLSNSGRSCVVVVGEGPHVPVCPPSLPPYIFTAPTRWSQLLTVTLDLSLTTVSMRRSVLFVV